jgi:hypothetical protein
MALYSPVGVHPAALEFSMNDSQPLGAKDENTSSPSSTTGGQTQRRGGGLPPHLWQNLFWAARFSAIVLIISLALALPIIIYRKDSLLPDDVDVSQERQYAQLIYYIFAWLLTTWCGGCISYALACWLPYLFRFVSRLVSA